MTKEYFKPGIKYNILLFPACAIRDDIKLADCNNCQIRGKCTSKLKESVDSKLDKE